MAPILKVQGGTPIHGERSLCFTCAEAHVLQGQAVSDLTVICRATYDHPLTLTKPVVECSEYVRKNSQDRRDMERIAWILETKKGRPIGFVTPLEHKHRSRNGDVDEPEED